ncbi:complement component C7 [Triplophysa dalaica]|uniref:complement component C7 n=1 Tax=Triplophysa dalaica TaxID=1582913 RepID=UPI0024DFEA24|nr:complement component C7 [Triplophysa dalaica]
MRVLVHGVAFLFCLLSSAALKHGALVRNSRSVLEPVHCQWGTYGSWSACDGCSKTQTQIRSIAVYPQFGGNPCAGSPVRTQPCSSAQVCPLEEGCGGRFRCQSGKCISQSLVCNGDQDCEEDGLDEQQKCNSINVCDLEQPPPNVELTGQGFDAVSRQPRGTVINTKSFGGLCRKTFSGDHSEMFRIPQNVVRYTFQVTAKSDFSEESFQSSWHYLHHIERHSKTTGTDYGHEDYTFHEELRQTKSEQLIIIKSDLEVGQFQNQAPEYLSLSEEFWKALLSLPVAYNYAAYRNVLERFGTHYISEGTLGAHMTVFLAMNEEITKRLKSEKRDYEHCVVTTHSILFFISWSTTRCQTDKYEKNDHFYRKIQGSVKKTDIIGGHPGQIAKLLMLNTNTPEENGNAFSQWSGSVKQHPVVIKQKLRPLNELVKEVPCAGVKKYYLKRAIETYLNEKNPCQCRECQNNGLRLILDNVCQCVCKPGTEGKACELGTPLGEQPGVINGDWACWSSWSSCREGQKSRTRSCSRPAPRGGKDCIGKAQETTACEDEQYLDYLRTMEPHCFDESLTPKESCKTPPALANGFVLYPKDEYLVGSKIEYTCIAGYHLIGSAIAECQENLKWLQLSKECKRTLCDPPKLPQDVTGRPWKVDYNIGEAITLSCPDGKEMEGPPEIQCNAGLAWSPQPKNTRCLTVSVKPTPETTKCKPWENLSKDKCVCKIPHECKSSLDVCATNVKRGQTQRLSVCKVKAMGCLGHQFTLANDSACQWPDRSSTDCPHCIPWENCDEQTNTCRCKTKDECSTLGPWIHVCVQLEGESAPETMTECEAGVRKCRGEMVRVVSVQPCQS